MSDFPYTTADVAEKLGCAPITVLRRAKPLGVGINLAGRAGMRYSDRDVEQLIEALRPVQAKKQPRKKKRSRVATAVSA